MADVCIITHDPSLIYPHFTAVQFEQQPNISFHLLNLSHVHITDETDSLHEWLDQVTK